MLSKRITAPTALAVSLADAKVALRLNGSALDSIVDAWVRAITEHAEHLTGRAIMQQTWQALCESFDDLGRIPRLPLVSISSVKYYDLTNTLQTLDPSNYSLYTTEHFATIRTFGAFPDTYERADAVIVEYVAGYGTSDTATPSSIKAYILAKLVEVFDPSNPPAVKNSFADMILSRFKVPQL
ncbi:Phage conserved hypothetical protein [uncultured Caudovirales phage]|uniref:Uncharacterized protein n=1 Tax=uncultured Caudovirales phage TaxID=2100421 RepID=A0A6J5P241_9CAUD|nr:Phage conserved hypothetical protein [uncultured Caudovirales phage]